jgi:hypothetical protein
LLAVNFQTTLGGGKALVLLGKIVSTIVREVLRREKEVSKHGKQK